MCVLYENLLNANIKCTTLLIVIGFGVSEYHIEINSGYIPFVTLVNVVLL